MGINNKSKGLMNTLIETDAFQLTAHRRDHVGQIGTLTRLVISSMVAATVLLSGCTTVGPDFKRPDAPVAEDWIETKAGTKEAKRESEEYADWWTLFNDPVLDVLIDKAYQQNLPLKIAGVRIAEARAQLGIATGQQYPQLQQLVGSVGRNGLSERSPNFNDTADSGFWTAEVGFDAAWEVDFWGRFRRGVESAEANLIGSIADYDDVLVSLTAEVASAYTQIRTFEERIAVALENVKIQKRSLEIADVRFRNGATTELDVRQAETLLRTTQATVPNLQIGLRQSKHALSVLLGMPPSELQDILGGASLIPSAPQAVAVGIPADLIRRRPDIPRAELDAAAQSALIGVAQADLYPRISILGNFGFLTSDTNTRFKNNSMSDLFTGSAFTYFVGPSVQWPILNYGRLKNNVRVQDARLEQLLVNYRDTVLQAAREVEDSLVGFIKSKEESGFLLEAVRASRRSVDLALVQYRDGVTDYQRVLDTQRELVNRQENSTVSRGNVVLFLIASYRALGGGWQIRVGKDFVPQETRKVMVQRTDWGKILPPRDVPQKLEPPPPAREQPFFRSPDW